MPRPVLPLFLAPLFSRANPKSPDHEFGTNDGEELFHLFLSNQQLFEARRCFCCFRTKLFHDKTWHLSTLPTARAPPSHKKTLGDRDAHGDIPHTRRKQCSRMGETPKEV
jgi:hypothetical protein